MLYLYGMVCYHLIPSKLATVGLLSQLTMQWCVPFGDFLTIRHNEFRDLTATLLTEVCHNVLTEPALQPISLGGSGSG